VIGLLLCGLAQQATLLAEPEAVRIGEPVTWTLLVEHDVDERVVIADDAVPPDDSWVLLEGPERVRVRDGEVAFTRLEWRLFSLEPGTRQLPPLAISLSSGLELEALAGAVEVAGELAPDEDAPREVLLPLEAPADQGAASWTPLLLVAGGLIGALALVSLRRRRGSGDAGADLASADLVPLETLLADGVAPVALAAELSQRLRTRVDALQAAPRPGLLDEEWLRAVEDGGGFAASRLEVLTRLLSWADRVEFAAEQPSRFALEETVREADALLADLDTAPAEVQA